MQTANSLQDLITAIFSEELYVEVPSPATDLLQGGYLDSLRMVELLLRLEERFGISINLESMELEHFRSVERIALLVERERQAA